MPLLPASIAEMMRSGQRDSDVLSSLLQPRLSRFLESSAAIIREFFPAELASRLIPYVSYESNMEAFCTLFYYIITTAVGQQTIGEEYVNIVQVDSSRLHHPQPLRRTLMIFLHCCGPFIVNRFFEATVLSVRTSTWILESRKEFVAGMLSKVNAILQWFHRLNRSLFFIGLSNDTIAKLLMSVGYISLRQSNVKPFPGFKVLGYFGLVQCVVTFLLELRNTVKNMSLVKSSLGKYTQESPVQTGDNSPKCTMCYEPFQQVTATPCGHLFCWQCIYPWATAKSACPICRDVCNSKDLILLVNFSLAQ